MVNNHHNNYVIGKETVGKKLKIDFLPFYDFSPSIKDPRNLGNGIRFLNRYLCSNIFSNPEKWNDKIYQFLKLHSFKGNQLLFQQEIQIRT